MHYQMPVLLIVFETLLSSGGPDCILNSSSFLTYLLQLFTLVFPIFLPPSRHDITKN